MKPVYLLLGMGALLVGIVGIFLPLIPTTGPLILAAFAFSRSSKRFHGWLINHRLLGRFISDFQSGKGIPLKTKVFAVTAMSAAFVFSVGWIISHLLIRVAVAAIGVWAIWYVLQLPTNQPD